MFFYVGYIQFNQVHHMVAIQMATEMSQGCPKSIETQINILSFTNRACITGLLYWTRLAFFSVCLTLCMFLTSHILNMSSVAHHGNKTMCLLNTVKRGAWRPAASFLMSLVRPHAVWCLRPFHPAQTLSPLPPNPLCATRGRGGWHPSALSVTHRAHSLCFAPLPDQDERPKCRQICTCKVTSPGIKKQPLNFVCALTGCF